jgi:hypothetical protein
MKKEIVCLLWFLLSSCTPPPRISPAMTFLQSLTQYRAEIEELENKPERWPERQALGDRLKNQYRSFIGASREFDRLADLDFKRRELVIALHDPSLRPQRSTEIEQELKKMEKAIADLIDPVKAQILNAELRAQQQPQKVEPFAAIGLMTLALEAFSFPSRPPSSSVTLSGGYVVNDHALFSTLRTPEGETYRCSTLSMGEVAAIIKCDPMGK